MPKTTFVRKPCTLDDVREGAEWIVTAANALTATT